jgi:hypothetical protein
LEVLTDFFGFFPPFCNMPVGKSVSCGKGDIMKVVILALVAVLVASKVFAQVADLDTLRGKYGASKAQIEVSGVAAYSNALAVLAGQLKKAGNLDDYLLVKAEQKRLVIDLSVAAGATNTCRVVSESAQRVLGDQNGRLATLLRAYVAALGDLVKTSMQADRIGEAKAAKDVMTVARFELADIETKLPKVEGTNEASKVTAAGKKIVIWNTHNGHWNDVGTRTYNVLLYSASAGNRPVWETKDVQIPWEANKDTSVTNEVPVGIIFSKVRVEVTKWEGNGGGLSEIQVLDANGKNMADHCKAIASGQYNSYYTPDNATDGTTSSGAPEYWQLPNGKAGWIEISLTKKQEAAKSKK